MLHTANKIIIFLILSIVSLAGNQTVDISLDLTYQGASQAMINDKMVIDLGFFREGEANKTIEIGTVNVRISQTKTAEDFDNCILVGGEFNSVNIKELKAFSQRIGVSDKIYIGNSNRIILTAKDIIVKEMQGSVDETQFDTFYFVYPECVQEGVMEGEALTSLSYSFKLYADIEGSIKKDSVIGAFAQDENGIAISVRNLIEKQIKNSNTLPYKRRK